MKDQLLAIERAIAIEQRELRLFIDNVRPERQPRTDTGDLPALARAGCGMFLIKASLRELEGLTGHSIQSEGAQETAARDVVAQGRAEIFVVSLGANGALLATAEGVRRFAAVPVDGQSSVGAGDSMVAGIVLGLVRGLVLDKAVKFGMAAGAATLLRPGTELCRRADAAGLYREMVAT